MAEIGASSVTDRVAELRLAKRTRTVTFRPGLDLARRRVPILVCKMQQGGSDNLLFGRLPADRRLRSYRCGPPVGLDLPWIAISTPALRVSLPPRDRAAARATIRVSLPAARS